MNTHDSTTAPIAPSAVINASPDSALRVMPDGLEQLAPAFVANMPPEVFVPLCPYCGALCGAEVRWLHERLFAGSETTWREAAR